MEKLLGDFTEKSSAAEKQCISDAKMDVLNEINNPMMNQVTGLNVSVVFTFEKREFSGEVTVLKSFRTEKDGSLVANGWFVSEMNADVNDGRDTQACMSRGYLRL